MNLKPIAGIDVAKYFSEMVVISPTNEILARLTIHHNNPSDFDRAIEILKKVEEDFAARPTIVISSHRALPQNPLPLLQLSGVGCFYYKPPTI
jgi:predicted NBD/HSP70 family sugar kinase